MSAAPEVFLSVEGWKAAVLSATTSSMGSDYMLTKRAYWNPTTSSQHPVIIISCRGFLTYKRLTIVDRGFINKPCFDPKMLFFHHSQLDGMWKMITSFDKTDKKQ